MFTKNSEQGFHYRIRNKMKKRSFKSGQNYYKKTQSVIKFCGKPPAQIGKKDIMKFYAYKDISDSTARDYYYAIIDLWQALGRKGSPPKPPQLRKSSQQNTH